MARIDHVVIAVNSFQLLVPASLCATVRVHACVRACVGVRRARVCVVAGPSVWMRALAGGYDTGRFHD